MLLGDPGDDRVLLGDLLLKGLDLGLEGPRRRGGLWRAQRARSVLEELALPVVEEARLQVVLLAELRDGDLVDVVATEDGGLLVGRERSAGFAGHGVSWCRFLCGGKESRDRAGSVQHESSRRNEW